MDDERIPTEPLEQEPTPLFLPVEDRVGLLHRVLADVRLVPGTAASSTGWPAAPTHRPC
jgi:hypothetical protein